MTSHQHAHVISEKNMERFYVNNEIDFIRVLFSELFLSSFFIFIFLIIDLLFETLPLSLI